MKKYRNEWKYCCTEKELMYVEARAKGILPIDSHASEEGRYVVRSLYFDDFVFSCAHDTEKGLAERYKYRIRYYGNSPQRLKLERKEKKCGRCRKQSCPITIQQYELIMKGEIAEVFWNTDSAVLKRFCMDVWKRGFEPKAIIEYERTAYVEEMTNIRITMDRDIKVSDDVEHFLDGNYLAVPVLERGLHVLEVKFDSVLPSYIKKVLYVNTLQQTSCSKYYTGIKRMRRGY